MPPDEQVLLWASGRVAVALRVQVPDKYVPTCDPKPYEIVGGRILRTVGFWIPGNEYEPTQLLSDTILNPST